MLQYYHPSIYSSNSAYHKNVLDLYLRQSAAIPKFDISQSTFAIPALSRYFNPVKCFPQLKVFIFGNIFTALSQPAVRVGIVSFLHLAVVAAQCLSLLIEGVRDI